MKYIKNKIANNLLNHSLEVEMSSNFEEDKDDLAFKSLLLDYLIEEGYEETLNAFDNDQAVIEFLSNYKSIVDKEVLRIEREKFDTKIFSLARCYLPKDKMNLSINIMTIVSIDYNEPFQEQYHSVNITHNGIETKFNSGNFIKDWYESIKFLTQLENVIHIISSSTVDSFIMDGEAYESAYLHTSKNENAELKYIDRNEPHWLINQADIFDKGIEIFVPVGTKPTWEELKELCK